jgi:phytoene dehydrogenase-like protein
MQRFFFDYVSKSETLSDYEGMVPEEMFGRARFPAVGELPYLRPDGRSWDEGKAEYARSMLERLRLYTTNLDEVLLDFHCDSPLDMERTSPSFLRGDLHGIATTTYQSGSHRPTPDLGQYRVPGTDRLYLVGPFQYPGGGVFGAGRATAQVMCEDLGIDFERLEQPP